MNKIKSSLNNVPETMLWTLHNRAVEAMRDDSILKDPEAVEIYKSIDYDYEKSFGKADSSHAVRSKDFDREIKKFLNAYPAGTIVNLGEGLETQRFRLNETEALWISVDVPSAIKIRETFIKPDERHVHLPVSAIDRSWFDSVPKHKPVFITAQGLLMYLPEKEIKSLMQDIAQTFTQPYLMFDTIPEWISNKTVSEKGLMVTKHYKAPPMPWGINRDHVDFVFKQWLSNEIEVIDMGYSRLARGFMRYFFPLVQAIPMLKKATPTIIKINFKK